MKLMRAFGLALALSLAVVVAGCKENSVSSPVDAGGNTEVPGPGSAGSDGGAASDTEQVVPDESNGTADVTDTSGGSDATGSSGVGGSGTGGTPGTSQPIAPGDSGDTTGSGDASTTTGSTDTTTTTDTSGTTTGSTDTSGTSDTTGTTGSTDTTTTTDTSGTTTGSTDTTSTGDTSTAAGTTDTTSPSGDGPMPLPQPAIVSLRFDGPAEQQLEVTLTTRSAVGDGVTAADSLWDDCLVPYWERPDACADYRVTGNWGGIGGEIETIDEQQFENSDAFTGQSLLDSQTATVQYGSVWVSASIDQLPSYLQSAQVSRLHTTVARWQGLPDYFTVQTDLTNGELSSMLSGTLIRVYIANGGVDATAPWDLVEEARLSAPGSYEFQPPGAADSQTQFMAVISQWVTVTNQL